MVMEPRTNSVSNLSDDIKIQLFKLLSWGNVECSGLQLLHMNRTQKLNYNDNATLHLEYGVTSYG